MRLTPRAMSSANRFLFANVGAAFRAPVPTIAFAIVDAARGVEPHNRTSAIPRRIGPAGALHIRLTAPRFVKSAAPAIKGRLIETALATAARKKPLFILALLSILHVHGTRQV